MICRTQNYRLWIDTDRIELPWRFDWVRDVKEVHNIPVMWLQWIDQIQSLVKDE